MGIETHSYGTLNLARLTSSIEKGIIQLNASAERELDEKMPRVIVLAFTSGIGFDWSLLESHLDQTLKINRTLSAIAVLRWSIKSEPLFEIFHNSSLEDVRTLPGDAFVNRF